MILNCNCYQLIFILDLQSIGNLGYVAVSYLYILLVVVVVVLEEVVARNVKIMLEYLEDSVYCLMYPIG